MNTKLNALLSNLEIFYHKLQSFHWYVAGETFFQAHAQLEHYYDEISEQVDEVAEAILMNGGTPVSTVKDFLSLATISEGKNEFDSNVRGIIETVKADFESLLAEVKEIKVLADEEGNYFISAKMDEFIGSYTKTIWMLSQFLMK